MGQVFCDAADVRNIIGRLRVLGRPAVGDFGYTELFPEVLGEFTVVFAGVLLHAGQVAAARDHKVGLAVDSGSPDCQGVGVNAEILVFQFIRYLGGGNVGAI